MGVFRTPHSIGEGMSGVYKMQFVGHALRHDESMKGYMSYWKRFEAENKIFNAYPYSDADEMLRKYGSIYQMLSVDAFKDHCDKYNSAITAKLREKESRSA